MTQKIVTLEDRHIAQMLREARFVNEFPFLVNLAGDVNAASKLTARKKCGTCAQARKAAEAKQAYNRVKEAIVNMSEENQRKFKKLLSADEVKIEYRSSSTGKKIRASIKNV